MLRIARPMMVFLALAVCPGTFCAHILRIGATTDALTGIAWIIAPSALLGGLLAMFSIPARRRRLMTLTLMVACCAAVGAFMAANQELAYIFMMDIPTYSGDSRVFTWHWVTAWLCATLTGLVVLHLLRRRVA